MSQELLPRLTLGILLLAAASYLGSSMYSQPRAQYRQIEPVRTFLRHALAHDSAALSAQAAAEQPVKWALAATDQDSLAVLEWAESRPAVRSTRRGDTLWVTLRRPGSTDRCSPLFPLTAGFLSEKGRLRLIHLSSSCPSVTRSSMGVN
jgi:hypothetical protein